MALASSSRDEIRHWFQLGNDYLNSSQYEKAVLTYDRIIEIDPQNAGAWNNRGLAQARQNMFEDAAGLLIKRARLTPRMLAPVTTRE